MSGVAPDRPELVDVTPGLAALWLSTSRQGDVDNHRVARFAAAMRDGAWQPQRQRPVTMHLGRLGDGNHRLAAVVEAGVTVPMWVRPPRGPLDVTRPEEVAPMKIRMLTSMVGPNVSLSRGDVVERPAEAARRLIDAGFAEPVKQPRKQQTETTSVEPPETTEG